MGRKRHSNGSASSRSAVHTSNVSRLSRQTSSTSDKVRKGLAEVHELLKDMSEQIQTKQEEMVRSFVVSAEKLLSQAQERDRVFSLLCQCPTTSGSTAGAEPGPSIPRSTISSTSASTLHSEALPDTGPFTPALEATKALIDSLEDRLPVESHVAIEELREETRSLERQTRKVLAQVMETTNAYKDKERKANEALRARVARCTCDALSKNGSVVKKLSK